MPVREPGPRHRLAAPWRARFPVRRAVLAAACALIAAAPARALPSGDDFWIVNGQVYVTKLAGTTLYVAGNFKRISPRNGSALPFDSRTAQPIAGFPRVKGNVYALISDGAGGWYIGGSFRMVGSKQCTNIAHVLPDMTVADWNVGFERAVASLALDGDVLYVSHGSTLEAIDVVTRESLPFHAEFDATARVMVRAGGRLVVGGDFMQVNGANQYGIAALDPTTGALLNWKPAQGLGASMGTRSLAIVGDVVYVGGRFAGKLNGTLRRNAAAFDLRTGATLAWNPDPDYDVSSLLLRDGVIYAGGGFQTIGGQPRAFLAALDPATGQATSWTAALDERVDALVPDGDRMWISGGFAHVGGVPRGHLAQLDRLSGSPTDWSTTQLTQAPAHISLGAGAMYVVGTTTVGSMARNGTAAFDITTGLPTAWDPGARDVNAIEVDRGVVYLGGYFRDIGGHPRPHLAAVSATTGQLLTWNPAPDGAVTALLIQQRTLYVAGVFRSIASARRSGLAAFAPGRQLLPWDPGMDGFVRSMVSDGHVLYLGGEFGQVGGQRRRNLAAARLSDGRATPWDPGADAPVRALTLHAGTVFAGGLFEHVGGQAREYLAGIDERTGLVTSFDAHADDVVLSLATDGTVLYAGGFVTPGAAAFSATNGDRLAWAPPIFGPQSFAVSGGLIYVGCLSSGHEVDSELSGLDVGPGVSVPSAVPNLIATPAKSLAVDRLEPREFRLRFTLETAALTRLEIYDVTGRRVATLADGVLQAGEHEFTWDGRGTATRAGVYFALLHAAGTSTSRKLVVF